jgi:hypothetical protein
MDSALEKPEEALGQTIGLRCLALPDCHDAPAKPPQLTYVVLVARLVPCELRHPVLLPGFRQMGVNAPWMLVPKTALHLDDAAKAGEDQVGPPRKAWNVEPEPDSHAMHESPHSHLRKRVPAAYLAHILRAPLWSEVVSQNLDCQIEWQVRDVF